MISQSIIHTHTYTHFLSIHPQYNHLLFSLSQVIESTMPKFYCDYCDTYLTHDSPSVRKTHCQGRKHKENVRDYYQKWMEEQAQKLVRTSRCRPSIARLTCSLRLDRSHHSGLQIRKTTQRTVRHARCSPDGPAHGPTTAGYASDDATLGLPHATGHETTRTHRPTLLQ